MKTFLLGAFVGISLSAAAVSAQSGWSSFEGSVFEDAARNQQRKFDMDLQQLRHEQWLRERDRKPC